MNKGDIYIQQITISLCTELRHGYVVNESQITTSTARVITYSFLSRKILTTGLRFSFLTQNVVIHEIYTNREGVKRLLTEELHRFCIQTLNFLLIHQPHKRFNEKNVLHIITLLKRTLEGKHDSLV